MQLTQKQENIQGLRQEQLMTHQQIQALEILATPIMQLQQMVSMELEKNPILEAETKDENITLPSEEASSETSNNEDNNWIEQLINIDDKFSGTSSSITYLSEEDEERRQYYLNNITTEISFHEDLKQQLSFKDLDGDIKEASDVVLTALDDNGYLAAHPADLAMVSKQKIELIESAVKIVQSLDPPGVGASDLKERLMIQLERKNLKDSLAYKVVENHLDDIASNRLPSVAKSLRVKLEEMKPILDTIKSLKPIINKIENKHLPNEYIQEEIIIRENKNELFIDMNERYLPTLKISNYYKKMLSDENTSPEVVEYIKEKIKGASFLINSLSQRQNTLHKIVTAIVNTQKEFFLQGPDKLKPLKMSQVAEEIGVHETTVSRGVAGKYMRCEHGLISLRQFFSTGYEDKEGNCISNTVVKRKIRELIDNENESAPLSDSKIANILTENGLTVARRTVAKYRESMNIASSKQRRCFWEK